jgi:hypothetical protein
MTHGSFSDGEARVLCVDDHVDGVVEDGVSDVPGERRKRTEAQDGKDQLCWVYDVLWSTLMELFPSTSRDLQRVVDSMWSEQTESKETSSQQAREAARTDDETPNCLTRLRG